MTICGGKVLAVNEGGNGVTYGGAIPVNDPAGCFFTATAGGANLTQAGVTAGVQVVAWIAHNGTFVGGTPLGQRSDISRCSAPAPATPAPARRSRAAADPGPPRP